MTNSVEHLMCFGRTLFVKYVKVSPILIRYWLSLSIFMLQECLIHTHTLHEHTYMLVGSGYYDVSG